MKDTSINYPEITGGYLIEIDSYIKGLHVKHLSMDDIFDDGDVIASSILKPRSFLLNKTTWFIIQLFSNITTFDVAKQKFIEHFNKDEIFLSEEFEKIFNNLLKNEIIKGV